MYKVIISDDNPIICKALSSRIPWQELGLTLSGMYYNGQEVLDAIVNLTPDIIITDIRMPMMDGLAMIEQLRLQQVEVQIIIISGYNDYLYLKKAIDFDVVGYLFKPTQNDELMKYLHKAIHNLRDKQEHRLISKREHIRNGNLILQTLIRGTDRGMKESGSFELASSVASHYWLLIQLPLDDSGSLLSLDYDKLIAFENAINLIDNAGGNCRILLPSNTMLAILCEEQTTESMLKIDSFVRQLLEQEIPEIKSIISNRFSDYEQLEKQFKLAIASLYQNVFSRSFVPTVDNNPAQILSIREQQTIRIHLSLSDYKGCYYYLENICSSNRFSSPNHLDSFVSKVLQLYTDYIPLFHTIQTQMESNYLSSLAFTSFEQFLTILRNSTNNLDMEDSNKADEIVAFIENNCTQPLTLNFIAKKFHYNSIYLGQLVKRETGTSFNQYINKLRVDRAIEIIRKNPNVKLSDLALELGFSDSKYFSKVFKKITGYSPSKI